MLPSQLIISLVFCKNVQVIVYDIECFLLHLFLLFVIYSTVIALLVLLHIPGILYSLLSSSFSIGYGYGLDMLSKDVVSDMNIYQSFYGN